MCGYCSIPFFITPESRSWILLFNFVLYTAFISIETQFRITIPPCNDRSNDEIRVTFFKLLYILSYLFLREHESNQFKSFIGRSLDVLGESWSSWKMGPNKESNRIESKPGRHPVDYENRRFWVRDKSNILRKEEKLFFKEK